MAGITKGKDFMMYVNDGAQDKVICHATDWSKTETYETIEISGPQSRWRDYIGGYAGYTLQVPGLVAYTDEVNIIQLQEWARSFRRIPWYGSAYATGGVIEEGVMIITSITQTAQFRDAMRFDMQAIGCGEPETNLEPITGVAYLADFDSVRLPGCPNPYPVVIYWYDGTFVGIADNPDDVVDLYNNYAGNAYYTISPGTSGCDFNIAAVWNAPELPNVIFAAASGDFAMWSGTGDEAISPDQDNDQALTPIGA